MAASFSTTVLDSNWEFRLSPVSESRTNPIAGRSDDLAQWRSARPLPTEVFLDLLEHDLIPDPFISQNEALVQWVGEENWHYRTKFASPSTAAAGTRHELVFDGLDTFATVKLNGEAILESDNMFISHRVDVTKQLKKEGENELEIGFRSAWFEGKKVVKEWPDHVWGCWNGDVSRLAVRKAQYHYGWDWGPMLLTCGPWKPIRLETFTTRISELSFSTEITGSTATVTVTATVDAPLTSEEGSNLVFTLTAPSQDRIMTTAASISTTTGSSTSASGEFTIKDPQLWYPHGYGDQPLYTLTATLGESRIEKRIGLRDAKLIRRKLDDEPGTSFFFEINGIPVFAAGVNWIPADNFLTRVDEKNTRRWLQMVKDARFVMVRVWGGGIYETDVFYDICDELGLLVWQDFLFGCGNYPGEIPFLQGSIATEAAQNVQRLCHHPSLIIFAGNNEDYAYLNDPDKPDLGYDPKDTDPKSWLKSKFPARYIYEHILPTAVAENAPHIIYHPGSPYASVEHPSGDDLQNGDVHQWNVWHGKQLPYQEYSTISGRFVSEFGMEGYPALSTIKSFTTEPSQRHAFSADLEWHNKATGGEHRLAGYLADNFKFRTDPLEAYIYFTQLLQSEALATAYRDWRRRWKGPGKELTGGALVWQINDCWPVTSWAIVDSRFVPKMAYHTIRDALKPLTVGAVRREVITPDSKHPDSEVRKKREWSLDIWISNLEPLSNDSKCEFELTVTTFSVTTGEKVAEYTHPEKVPLPDNRSVDICTIPIPGLYHSSPSSSSTRTYTDLVAEIRISIPDTDFRPIGYINFPEPLKLVDFPTDPAACDVVLYWAESAQCLKASVKRPVKGFVIDLDDRQESGEAGTWYQGHDLVPGSLAEVAQHVGAKKEWVGKKVTARWVGVEDGVQVEVREFVEGEVGL